MNTRLSKPDIIIYNARIFDAAIKRLYCHTAISIRQVRIHAVGSNDEILGQAGKNTQRIDARGCWLLPALMDSHTHLTGYALRKLQVDLSNCQSLDKALEKIKKKVASVPERGWITGGGWDKNAWGMDDFPHKKHLDDISIKHFIALNSKDWHSLWVNSPVLQLCRMDRSYRDPPGGHLRRDSQSGEPTGILQETAREPVYQHIPPPSYEQISRALKDSFREFYEVGITGVHCMETPQELDIYKRLHRNGELGLRIFFYIPVRCLPQLKELQEPSGADDSFLKLCGVKIFVDGALGSQSAEMLQNYPGLNHAGIEVLTEAELQQQVVACIQQGQACAIHAIGDRANRKALNVLAKVAPRGLQKRLRHRIEHAQMLHPRDIPRFARFQIIASMQPIHLAADIPLIERYCADRAGFAYAFNKLLKKGTPMAFGSDTPIESFNPWKGLYTAVKRKYLCQPDRPSFHPEEIIDLRDAVLAYTLNSAFAVGEEHRLGTIAAGKQADLILIDQDIFNQPAESLLDTRVLLTIQAGRVVYRRE